MPSLITIKLQNIWMFVPWRRNVCAWYVGVRVNSVAKKEYLSDGVRNNKDVNYEWKSCDRKRPGSFRGDVCKSVPNASRCVSGGSWWLTCRLRGSWWIGYVMGRVRASTKSGWGWAAMGLLKRSPSLSECSIRSDDCWCWWPGSIDRSNNATSCSRVAIRASFVSNIAETVAMWGRPPRPNNAFSSWFWTVRSVSLAALSSFKT